MDCSPPGSSVHGDSPGKNTGMGCHFLLQCMKVKSESEVAQSCPTLCDPMDCSLPGSSRGPSQPMSPTLQVDSLPTKPPGNPKKMKWEPLPSPGDLPNPGIECKSPTLEVDSLPSEPPGKSYVLYTHTQINTIYWTIKKAGE